MSQSKSLPMPVPRTRIQAAVAAALMLACGTALAADPPARAPVAQPDADRQRLEDAQKRLEAAAEEVAELSLKLSGHDRDRLMFLPGASQQRVLLGVGLGPVEGGEGAKVVSVTPRGPAAEAGVKQGDVIVGLNGKGVKEPRDVINVVEDVEPGAKLALDLRRDGKPVRVTATAREIERKVRVMTRRSDGPEEFNFQFNDLPGDVMRALPFGLGLLGDAELTTLTPALGRYFGTDKGVLVVRAPTTPDMGLEDGDVIVAIGGREPADSAHAMRILGSYEPGEKVKLDVLRQRKRQSVEATLPERRGPAALGLSRRIAPAPPVPPRPPGAT